MKPGVVGLGKMGKNMACMISRNLENDAAKLLATMRNPFGGHAVKEVQDNDE